jgi:hypothetical protein
VLGKCKDVDWRENKYGARISAKGQEQGLSDKSAFGISLLKTINSNKYRPIQNEHKMKAFGYSKLRALFKTKNQPGSNWRTKKINNEKLHTELYT